MQEGEGRVQVEREAGPRAHAFIRVLRWSTLGVLGLSQVGKLNPKRAGFAKFFADRKSVV